MLKYTSEVEYSYKGEVTVDANNEEEARAAITESVKDSIIDELGSHTDYILGLTAEEDKAEEDKDAK